MTSEQDITGADYWELKRMWRKLAAEILKHGAQTARKVSEPARKRMAGKVRRMADFANQFCDDVDILHRPDFDADKPKDFHTADVPKIRRARKDRR